MGFGPKESTEILRGESLSVDLPGLGHGPEGSCRGSMPGFYAHKQFSGVGSRLGKAWSRRITAKITANFLFPGEESTIMPKFRNFSVWNRD
jgi:hypothetical protein